MVFYLAMTHLSALKRVLKLIRAVVGFNFRCRVYVREIGGDTRCIDDIVQRQLSDEWRLLEEQRQRLADAATRSHNGDLSIALQRGND